jgi:hypothetical protein
MNKQGYTEEGLPRLTGDVKKEFKESFARDLGLFGVSDKLGSSLIRISEENDEVAKYICECMTRYQNYPDLLKFIGCDISNLYLMLKSQAIDNKVQEIKE